MSRSNNDKPFYVDVGTSIVAVRCASNHDVIVQYDHGWHPHTLKLAKDICDRMNMEVEIHNSGNYAKLRDAVKAVVNVGYPHNFQIEASHIRGYCYDITRAIDKCFAALSASPRNCDVGTAEEQCAREIMCREDFERVSNVRIAEKCCANCKHGVCEYEGCATCRHPKRNDGGYTFEEGELT